MQSKTCYFRLCSISFQLRKSIFISNDRSGLNSPSPIVKTYFQILEDKTSVKLPQRIILISYRDPQQKWSRSGCVNTVAISFLHKRAKIAWLFKKLCSKLDTRSSALHIWKLHWKLSGQQSNFDWQQATFAYLVVSPQSQLWKTCSIKFDTLSNQQESSIA